MNYSIDLPSSQRLGNGGDDPGPEGPPEELNERHDQSFEDDDDPGSTDDPGCEGPAD